jgi:hydrogenase maturation protease
VKVLVFGIGNPLRSDDGAGVSVIEALRKENLKDTTELREDISGLDILGSMIGYDRVIIVDAIQSGGEPGTIYKLSLDDLGHKKTLHAFSSHDINFLAMLEYGKDLFPGKIPEDIIIIAIEAEDITTISERCTLKVEKTIKKAIEMIKELQ